MTKTEMWVVENSSYRIIAIAPTEALAREHIMESNGEYTFRKIVYLSETVSPEELLFPVIKPIPNAPVQPSYPYQRPNTSCTQCGLDISGITGYACQHFDCPCGLGPTICSSFTCTDTSEKK